jgi:DNA-binding SARP family transcriptional activator
MARASSRDHQTTAARFYRPRSAAAACGRISDIARSDSPARGDMWLTVLGALSISHEDRHISIPAAKHRAVLAALLMKANQVVSADSLAETVWDGSPPPAARVTIQGYISRLRQLLAPAVGTRIVTRSPGYVAQFHSDELDLLRFTDLFREGSKAFEVREWARASSALGTALSLWRETPLCDVPCERLRQEEIPRLDQMRLQAAEWRADAELRLGRHEQLVPELRDLLVEQPLRERLHAQLMIALSGANRRAEALAAYRDARDILRDELGIDPGPELRQLHQRILQGESADSAPFIPNGSPALRPMQTNPVGLRVKTAPMSTVPSGELARDEIRPPLPRQLPATVRNFVGRDSELRSLTGLLDSDSVSTQAAVISVITGTAGVGKTALAVCWAHLVADRYPDGQLYMNLRGYDPSPPVPTGDALAAFLRAFGVPGPQIPAQLDERASLYRSLLADQRVLVVLDNAASTEQVRPLLPGTAACAAVVTSRDPLSGLVAIYGATRLDLEVLPVDNAVHLLRLLIGERVDADPFAAKMLAMRCARLPLALRVAAELAVARPAQSLPELAAEVAADQRMLGLPRDDQERRTERRHYRNPESMSLSGAQLSSRASLPRWVSGDERCSRASSAVVQISDRRDENWRDQQDSADHSLPERG